MLEQSGGGTTAMNTTAGEQREGLTMDGPRANSTEGLADRHTAILRSRI